MTNLNEHINDKMDEVNAPQLFSIPKQNNFKMPANYFEDLSEKLSHQLIPSKNEIQIKNKSVIRIIPYALMPVAASLALIIYINTKSQEMLPIAQINQEAKMVTTVGQVEQAIEQQLNGVDNFFLVANNESVSSDDTGSDVSDYTISDLESIFDDENFD
jgi:hypothetical protein